MIGLKNKNTTLGVFYIFLPIHSSGGSLGDSSFKSLVLRKIENDGATIIAPNIDNQVHS